MVCLLTRETFPLDLKEKEACSSGFENLVESYKFIICNSTQIERKQETTVFRWQPGFDILSNSPQYDARAPWEADEAKQYDTG